MSSHLFSRRTTLLAVSIFLSAALLVPINGAPPAFQKKGTGGVTALVRLPSGDVFVVGTEDGVIRLWDMEKSSVLIELDAHSGSVHGLDVDSREQWIAAAYDKQIGIWDLTKRRFEKLATHDAIDYRSRVIAHHDGRTVVAYGHDNDLVRWNGSSGKRSMTYKGHHVRVHAAALKKDGSILVSGDIRGEIIIWDFKTGKIAHRVDGQHDSVASITFLGDTQLFATGSAYHGGIKIWDSQSGKVKAVIGKTARTCYWALNSSPDGKFLSAGLNLGNVGIWKVESGETIKVINAHPAFITGTQFSRNGTLVVSASGGWDFDDRRIDGQLSVWKLKNE